MLPFRDVSHVQGLLSQLYQGEHEGLFPGCRLIQPLRGAGTEGVPFDDAVHEAARLREMHRHHVRGQHHDTRVPQRQEVYEQGVRGAGQRRERHDGMVPRFQATPAVQRLRGGHNILPYRSKRGRQGRKGVERLHQASLREGVLRQGIYQEGTLRDTLRPRNTPRARTQSQYEEQAHAHVGQNHAQEKVCHRMHQRAAQEQGEHRALKTPLCTQFYNEHLFGTHRILLLR